MATNAANRLKKFNDFMKNYERQVSVENIIDSTDWSSVVASESVVWETQTFNENEDRRLAISDKSQLKRCFLLY